MFASPLGKKKDRATNFSHEKRLLVHNQDFNDVVDDKMESKNSSFRDIMVDYKETTDKKKYKVRNERLEAISTKRLSPK